MSGCDLCGARLEQPTRGRRRRFCSDACRLRSWRAERETKCEVGSEVAQEPPTARGVRTFATFADLDAWLEEIAA